MLFSHGSGQQWIDDNKKCRQIAGDFDGHGDAAVRREAHRPMEDIQASLEATGRRHRASACGAVHTNVGRKHLKCDILRVFYFDRFHFCDATFS